MDGTSVANDEIGAAFNRNAWLSNCDEDGLLSIFTQRHASRNLTQDRDTLPGDFNFGVPLVAIKYKAFKGSYKLS